MKKKLLLLFFSLSLICNSQNRIFKILVDGDTKKPLKAATISNSMDHTITNNDGRFVFYSENDSIIIRTLGYDKLKTTFNELKNLKDTIYLKQSAITLDEIVLKDYKEIIFSTYDDIEKNYSYSAHIDGFFLRCILKKNNSIIKIEDLSGKIKRNSMFTSSEIPKLNFEFQLLNQRKIGLISKNKMVEDIKLHSLEDLFIWFSTVFINPNHFEFIEEKIIDSSYTKVIYKPLQKHKNKYIGYYIIDNNNKSINEYYSRNNPNFVNDIEFEKKLGMKWRTINTELHIIYDRSIKNNKYFISNANLKQRVELYNRKKEKVMYEVEYQLITTEPFSDDHSFKANVRKSKELFRLKADFNKNFWLNQNQLPLTNELNEFIRNINKYEKDYKIISNF